MQQPEWKGGQSQRFSGGRVHLKPQNQLNSVLQPSHLQKAQCQGIRTFSSKPTPEAQFKPCLKIHHQQYSKDIDLRGKKALPFPQQHQRIRKQRGHVHGGMETSNSLALRGVKTYQESNKTRNKQYMVENAMQAKIKILGLEGQRNNLGVTALGDKSYKYPEYSVGFYKDRGLIAGSSGFYKGQQAQQNMPDSSKYKSVFTKPMWNVKVKMQEEDEQKEAVNSVDSWEQTTLKEANPNWNDPDTFFERMEKQGGQQAGKDKPKKK